MKNPSINCALVYRSGLRVVMFVIRYICLSFLFSFSELSVFCCLFVSGESSLTPLRPCVSPVRGVLSFRHLFDGSVSTSFSVLCLIRESFVHFRWRWMVFVGSRLVQGVITLLFTGSESLVCVICLSRASLLDLGAF